jgi:uncharacterized protein DUF1801
MRSHSPANPGNHAKKWQEETDKLRRIALDCGLTEELKWGKPCFTFLKRHVAIVIPRANGGKYLLCGNGAARVRLHGIAAKRHCQHGERNKGNFQCRDSVSGPSPIRVLIFGALPSISVGGARALWQSARRTNRAPKSELTFAFSE